MRNGGRQQLVAASVAVVVVLLIGTPLDAAPERTVHDIFVNGKLAPGVTLVNGRVQGGEIRTASLGADGWAKPVFQLQGLNIDISNVDLSQVHVRTVAPARAATSRAMRMSISRTATAASFTSRSSRSGPTRRTIRTT